MIDSWISIGLVFAGFAELQAAFYPSGHPGQVSLADMLRLMCSPRCSRGWRVPSAPTNGGCNGNVESPGYGRTTSRAPRSKSARGSRASCTTVWRRTSGSPS